MPSPTSPNLDNPGPREVSDPHDTSAAAGASGEQRQVREREVGFPNMAGKPDIDDALAFELEAAGIEVSRFEFFKDGRSEVNTSVTGHLHGWTFKRQWYYWSANGPGIELAAAERLYEAHKSTVRVAGHCGCPSPREWYKGLAVGDYHIDSPAGLKGLADTIRELVATPPSSVAGTDARDPTAEELQSEQFKAIWSVIKSWDINAPWYHGYCGATGNHVVAIMDALKNKGHSDA